MFGSYQVSGGRRAQFSCVGAALIKPVTNAPLSVVWESKLWANRDKLLFKAQEGVPSEAWEHPTGVCVAGGCFFQAPTPTTGIPWEWHCAVLSRVGRRRGSQSLCCSGSSHALSVLPVPCHCPLHKSIFLAASLPSYFLLCPEFQEERKNLILARN